MKDKIAKILTPLEINVTDSKLIKTKESVFNGEDFILDIIVKENDSLKEFNENCKVNCLITMDNKTYEEENIDFDYTTSAISFSRKLGKGKNMLTLSIADVNEVIYLCPIMINCIATSDNELIENNNDIRVFKDLEVAIEEGKNSIASINTDIVIVNNSVEKLTQDVVEVDKFVRDTVQDLETEVHEKLVETEIKADNELQRIQDKVDGKLEKMDTLYNKSITLEPYVVGNKINFRSDIINTSAKELVKYSYIIHVNGSPYANSIITSYIGLLTFSLESSGIVINLNTLLSKNIQGNSVVVTPKFNTTNSNIINQNEFGYMLTLESNLISTNIDNSKCVLSSISGGLL